MVCHESALVCGDPGIRRSPRGTVSIDGRTIWGILDEGAGPRCEDLFTMENTTINLDQLIKPLETNDSPVMAVIDHKTAAKKYDDERVANDLQLTAYSYVRHRQQFPL